MCKWITLHSNNKIVMTYSSFHNHNAILNLLSNFFRKERSKKIEVKMVPYRDLTS